MVKEGGTVYTTVKNDIKTVSNTSFYTSLFFIIHRGMRTTTVPWQKTFYRQVDAIWSCLRRATSRWASVGDCPREILTWNPSTKGSNINFLAKIIILFNDFLCRIMRMYENGLFTYWYRNSLPKDPGHCLRVPKFSEKLREITPLSLKGLTGGFVIFAIGLCASLILLISEKMFSFWACFICCGKK